MALNRNSKIRKRNFRWRFLSVKRLFGYPLPIRNDDDLHILRQAHDSLGWITRQGREPGPRAGAREINLCNLIPPAEINQSGSDIIAFQNSRFNVEIACKIEVQHAECDGSTQYCNRRANWISRGVFAVLVMRPTVVGTLILDAGNPKFV